MNKAVAVEAIPTEPRPYNLANTAAVRSNPLVLDFPHVGDRLPSRITPRPIRPIRYARWLQGRDLGVKELFAGHDAFAKLEAAICRGFIDLNRPTGRSRRYAAPTDRDRRYRADEWSESELVWTRFPNGEEIYVEPMSEVDLHSRIGSVYRRYFDKLDEIFEEALTFHPRCLYLNMHSMPLSCVSAYDPDCDLVVGNLHNLSASRETTKIAVDAFVKQGFKVRVNHPFAGGECIGRTIFDPGVQALQLEFNRDKFWNAERDAPTLGFGRFRRSTLNALDEISRTFVQR